jgi:hypothetical protein
VVSPIYANSHCDRVIKERKEGKNQPHGVRKGEKSKEALPAAQEGRSEAHPLFVTERNELDRPLQKRGAPPPLQEGLDGGYGGDNAQGAIIFTSVNHRILHDSRVRL